MIHLEARFSCSCPGRACQRQLDAANWETAAAEVRLMKCENGGHRKYVVCDVVLTEYDEKGCLTDLDELSWESRRVA